MGASIKRLTLVVVLALIATLTATPPVTAQESGGVPQRANQAGLAVLEPGSDRPPLGGPRAG